MATFPEKKLAISLLKIPRSVTLDLKTILAGIGVLAIFGMAYLAYEWNTIRMDNVASVNAQTAWATLWKNTKDATGKSIPAPALLHLVSYGRNAFLFVTMDSTGKQADFIYIPASKTLGSPDIWSVVPLATPTGQTP